jgi:polysaccharide export outer membrane protein
MVTADAENHTMMGKCKSANVGAMLTRRVLMPTLLGCLLCTYSFSQNLQESTDRAALRSKEVAPSENKPSLEPVLRVDSGDVLEVKVYTIYGAPDITQLVRVSSNGDIELPLAGRVAVAGLTVEEVQSKIEQKFKDGQYLKNPHVAVFVTEYATQGVSVLGEVAKPGIYPVVGSRTLLDVLSVAGGLTPVAGNTVTITRRQPPQEKLSVVLSGDSNSQQNVPIFPGDTVFVDKTGILYVVGDVGKPGGFPINNRTQLTVLQAIALAEGTKPNAALNGAKLIRKTENNFSEIEIPLKKILTGKSPDLTLRAGDIIFVPGSAAKGAAKRTLEAIVQTATGMAIYTRY